MSSDSAVRRAAETIRPRLSSAPDVALVLGSGLGELAEAAENTEVFATADIEGYPRATVAGHRGRLVFGSLEDIPVVIVQGRVHLYEGHGLDAVAFPVRLVRALGARRIVLTNAAGGINPAFGPGTLMLITDHLNFSGAAGSSFLHASTFDAPPSPTTNSRLSSPSSSLSSNSRRVLAARVRTFPTPYSAAWIRRVDDLARGMRVALQHGTYAWVRGPSYETKAEIRALRRMGADAVGMSTVPEALLAASLGMEVLGLSTITNPAAGLGDQALSHEDVLETGRRVRDTLEGLIRAILRQT